MEDHADAFIVLPGGIGTFEEFFEILTLKQLGRMNKPIMLFNLNGYYDPLLRLLEENHRAGFHEAGMPQALRQHLTIARRCSLQYKRSSQSPSISPV